MSEPTTPTLPPPGQQPLSTSMLDNLFGTLWPDRASTAPRLAGAALGTGVLAALVLPGRPLGLGTALVLFAMLGVAAAARLTRTTGRGDVAALLLASLLVLPVVLRDAEWIAVLCVFAAAAVVATTLTGGRSVPALVASVVAVPLAGLRGLPWLRRSATPALRGNQAARLAVLRTALLSVVLVAGFAALFSAADPLFARWAGALVPDLRLDWLPVRVVVAALVGGITLAAVYVALSPPAVERLALGPARPVRRYEWLVPVLLVNVTVAVFLAAQAAALFGGHSYLQETTGLTYAEYVHQGFGQLTVATMLTLAVVAFVVRRAARDDRGDRLVLRLALGLLCVLTLVVVASALHRMHVYEEAYGFTRLRVLVSVFEAWLGLLLAMVLAAGVRLRGRWVPRAALLTGAVTLLLLAAVNPDRWIAEQNVERYQETGRVDWSYLAGLSADAAPVLADLPPVERACALGGLDRGAGADGGTDDWLGWNLARARASEVPTVPTPPACPGSG